MKKQVNEAALDNRLKKVEEQASRYFDKYKSHMSDYETKSILSKTRKVGMYDIYALGKQLESFDLYKAMCEEAGNVNLLGKLPSIAYDVITAVQGASIIPIVASVQPIEEEQGIVYFKQLRASTTRGSVTAGDILIDPRQPTAIPSGYSSGYYNGVVGSATVSGTMMYNFTLAGAPVKSQSFKVFQSDMASTVKGQDVGSSISSAVGEIYGMGISGTINYATGAVSLVLSADPGDGKHLVVSYQQNFELSADLPQLDSFFTSKSVTARVFALKGTMGMMQSYGMQKRFGMSAEEELAKDLVQEINREIGGQLISSMYAQAVGVTNWSRTAPVGVSYFEHKQTFKDALAAAESVLVGNAGRGTVSVIVAGRTQCNVISTLPGWKKISDGSTLGSHVYGELDGITVVRVLESNIMSADSGLCIYKGQSPFEAPAVYTPYMPLAVTDTLPMAPNPLQSMKAAAVVAGIDNLVPQYATQFNVVA